MIVVDLGEGLVYPSHPELSIKGSWTPEKLRTELDRLGRPEVPIEVDGGIGPANAREIVRAGAGILVAGSSVFKAQDPAAAILAMQQADKMAE